MPSDQDTSKRFGVGKTNDLIRDSELARRLGYKSPRTLRRMFERGQGPAAVRIGKFLFYRVRSVSTWIAAQERKPRLRQGGK